MEAVCEMLQYIKESSLLDTDVPPCQVLPFCIAAHNRLGRHCLRAKMDFIVPEILNCSFKRPSHRSVLTLRSQQRIESHLFSLVHLKYLNLICRNPRKSKRYHFPLHMLNPCSKMERKRTLSTLLFGDGTND